MTSRETTPRPIIALGALGGTIAMKPAEPGAAVSPDLDADDLIAAVPGLADVAEIRAESICNVSSPQLMMDNVLAALAFAQAAVADGAVGVVFTHGTDTLEETAFLLSLLWDRPEPLVLTGAMRSPNLAGADGPANVLAAVLAASDPELRDCGALVAFNDEIHEARAVTKTHASSTATFQSPGWGPIARVIEGHVEHWCRPHHRTSTLPVPEAGPVRIPVIEAGLADDGHFLDVLADGGAAAIVISASGGGHVSQESAERCAAIVERGLPVIVATKTGSGRTLKTSYGYPGSESDLIDKGVIMAGYLSPRKARLLAHVALAAGADIARLREIFHDHA